MNIQNQKDCKISAQDRYDIISRAIDVAEDDGYLSQFVFECALYDFTANHLYPEQEIEQQILESSPMVVWDNLLTEGIIDMMIEDYALELEMIAEDGAIWFEDYQAFRHSARGVVDVIEAFTGAMANGVGKQLDMFKADSDIASVYDIAEKWGINNDGSQILGASE